MSTPMSLESGNIAMASAQPDFFFTSVICIACVVGLLIVASIVAMTVMHFYEAQEE